MISYWGVDHGVSKSYVGGGKWVKASKLKAHFTTDPMFPASKYKVATKLTGKHERHPSNVKGRTLYGEKGKQGQLRISKPRKLEDPTLLGFAQPDGRGGGRIVVRRDDPQRASTLRHEQAHIAPRRNAYHFGDRMRNPVRQGREEGRADFVAHGSSTPDRYPGTPEFKSGYDEVQLKMAQARRGKKR